MLVHLWGILRRPRGERLGELRALLGEFRARRSKRVLGKRLRRFAGAERGLRVLQSVLNPYGERVRATEHAARGPFRFLKCFYGLTEIDERGTIVQVEGLRKNPPHLECEFMAFSENAPCHGHHFAHQ